ncbi:MAG: hypothetical protein U5Q16_17930 [Gammaproteobacteria bacterium]|nr:hypothetical protein [Gammaproteobacteria bacterium]
MKDDIFKKITEGAKEAIAIEKGELAPARTTVYRGAKAAAGTGVDAATIITARNTDRR